MNSVGPVISKTQEHNGGPEDIATTRAALRLEWITISYNVIEAALAIGFGLLTSAISLITFGLDSTVEVTASVVLVWRLSAAKSDTCSAAKEKRAGFLVGLCFFGLGAFVAYEAIERLLERSAPDQSIIGVIIAAVSAVIMPLLGRAKHRLALKMNMSSLASEAAQTRICGYLSIILLVSLLVYRFTGWWWVDAVGALLMLPIIITEGIRSVRGQGCGCH